MIYLRLEFTQQLALHLELLLDDLFLVLDWDLLPSLLMMT